MSDTREFIDTVTGEAATEKIFAAEKSIAFVRTAVIVFNTVIYLLLLDERQTIPWLAYTIIFIANAYAAFVLLYKPYRKHPVFLASYFTFLTDSILITLWLLATGGYESPFYILWYISIIAVAFRFSARTILFTAFLYAACYLGLLASISELHGHAPEISVRLGYLFLVAWLGILVSRETLQQTIRKKQMERLAHEAREAGKRLIEQTRVHETLLKAQSELGEGVCIMEGLRFVYVNDALCNIYGYPQEELMSKTLLELVTPEERSILEQQLNELPEGANMSYSGNTIIINKHGKKVNITYSVKIIENGGSRQLFSIVRDVTEEVESKEALAQTNLDLERTKELEQKKDEFIGVASHELKTPLTSLKGYIQLLQRTLQKEKGPADAVLYAMKANTHIDKLNALISDLLDVSRIQAGKLQFNFDELDLGTLIEELAESLQHTSQTHKIIVKNLVHVTVKGDRARLEQVAANLITNAIKYSAKADKVIVDMKAGERDVIVMIEDFGTGIPNEFLSKVFDRFFRVEKETKVPGLGIGLYISAEFIRRHGGRIWAESELGKGSRFFFSLPVH